MREWLAITASIILVTSAQLLMKLGMNDIPTLSIEWFSVDFLMQHFLSIVKVFIGLACYALSLACWLLALKRLPLSIAYPCLSISYILVTLVASLLLDEPLSMTMLAGSGLIMIGVSLITYKKIEKET